MTRDNFPNKLKRKIEMRAAYRCSNPDCCIQCVGPAESDEEKVKKIGVVAHITAASPGGPRYDSNISKEKRKSASNAIFLCSNCADMIDKNKGIDYSFELLKEWKRTHEEKIKKEFAKGNESDYQKKKKYRFTNNEMEAMANCRTDKFMKEDIDRILEFEEKYKDYFKKSKLKNMALLCRNEVVRESIMEEIRMQVESGKKRPIPRLRDWWKRRKSSD